MTNSEAEYRRHLVEHNDACRVALAATSEPIRAYMRKHFRLDLYPLEFVTRTIADLEALVRASGAVPTEVSAVDPIDPQRAGS